MLGISLTMADLMIPPEQSFVRSRSGLATAGFAGMRPKQGVLCFYPRLPQHWRSLVFTLAWQGTLLDVVIEKRVVSVHCHPRSRKPVDARRKVAVEVDGQRHELRCGELRRFRRAAVAERTAETKGVF